MKQPLVIIGLLAAVFLAVFLVGCATQYRELGTTAEVPAPSNQYASGMAVGEENNIVEASIEDFAYNPSEITIKRGSTIRWTNKDSAKHTVTSDEGEFGSPLLSQGKTWSYIFEEPGTYNYHCAPHPYMKGRIIVE